MQKINDVAEILKAIHFAAGKHRNQRRKDVEATPYINHPIELADLLARVGGVTDLVTLQAAILHDTVEDTNTTLEELEEHFGAEVRGIVESVTDDKKLPKEERKRLQIEHAFHLSEKAKQVKIADKISNVLGVTEAPPADWTLKRRQDYLDWTEKVVDGCRGCNPDLENYFDQILQNGRQQLMPPKITASEALANFSALSAEEKRLVEVYVSIMTRAPSAEIFLKNNFEFGSPDALSAMVSLGSGLDKLEDDSF